MKTLLCALLPATLLALCVSSPAAEGPPALPEAGMQLREAYNQAIETATKPIRERYLGDLKRQQEQATRTGKLSEAMALKREIDRVVARKLLGLWATIDGIVTVLGDGTVRHSNGDRGTWQLEDTRMVVKWSNGFVHHYPLADTGEKIHAKATNPDGKTGDYVLTRIY